MKLPPEQEAIRAKCFHPSGEFVEFPIEDVETSIPARFEKIVHMYPNHLAVKVGKQALTYNELNRYANRIAHSLIEKRGQDRGPIALLLENGVAAIAAILGVLKSANYYVFLDPRVPLERLRYTLEKSGVSLLITDSLRWTRAQELNNGKLKSLNLDVLDLGTPDHDLGLAISGDAPDALGYTSGSEGYPKGVIQSQRVSLFCYWAIALRRPSGISDRLSLVHSLSFESSKLQLHQALLSGAGLFPFDVQRDGIAQMARWLEQEQITILHMPPALFRQLAEESPRPEKLHSLRLVYLSGEPITKLDFELYRKYFPNHTLMGCHMASTEARAMCSAIIDKDFYFPERGTIAGYAFPDKEILLLDDKGNEVKNGEVGQIAVRSRFIDFSGYVNRPELTDAKFLSETGNVEKKTYLTGDLGQKLPDGFLIHLGRMDRMVKIRGYRVELDEIERRLHQHPGIKLAAVTTWDRENGEKYLAAYLVARDANEPKIDELQSFLRETLPAYMLPEAFVFLSSLPLTNGKLDRKALPKPDGTRPELSTAYTRPRNDTEDSLVQIWEEVLDVRPIGIHDNFFDLGGHSLAATRVVSRVIKQFQLELPLQLLFRSPTIAEMAAVITEHHGKALDEQGLVADEIVGKNKSSTLCLPPEQEALRARCFHSSKHFREFPKEDVESSIPARFEKIVRAYPQRLAVKMGERSQTYDELNCAANRIGHAISEKCQGKSDLVALLFAHGLEVVAAMLGALKANKPWFALDPSESIERLRHLVATSGTAFVITDDQHLSLARKLIPHPDRVLIISDIDESVSSKDLNLNISANSIANIYLTSGSTGEPKSLYQTHGRILHDARNQTNFVHVTPNDKLSQLFSVSFSAGEIQLTRALLNGACLCLFDPKLSTSRDLMEWMKQEKLTICHFPVALFRQLAESIPQGERLSDLRLIHLSGAPISQQVFELYKNKFRPDVLLQIHMGSTEAGGICGALVDQIFCYPQTGTPTGYPYAGKKVSILDENGCEVQPGQTGQIAVTSRFLSRGDWKISNATESKYLINSGTSGESTYLTGDFGHVLPDGMLVHEGRRDFIAKIRGYRVNIYEIERALAAHPLIKDSAIVVGDRVGYENILVGYIVVAHGVCISLEEIRQCLRQSLPEYMVPSAIKLVKALPLTPSGKLDRKALPKPDVFRPDLSTPFSKPENDAEHRLVKIWEDILDVHPIGVHDNFFDLGGHSLLATQVVARVAQQFQLEMPLQTLFQSSTVAQMASVINQQQGMIAVSPLTGKNTRIEYSRDASEKGVALPLSYAQERLWFLSQLEPQSTVYNELKALRLKGRLNVEPLQRTLNQIVARHNVLRTTFPYVNDKPTQFVHEKGGVELPCIDISHLTGGEKEAELQQILSKFFQRPFDLQKDWPIRAVLIRLTKVEHVLTFVTHHIASDGWSSDILFRELSTLYEACCQGRLTPLEVLPKQYTDYAEWQRGRLQGRIYEEQLRYWKKQLEGISTLNLPTDFPRTAVQGHGGRTVKFTIPSALSSELKNLSRRERVTLFMTVLAAFQTLIHRYTGQTDIAVGTPTAGRSQPEFERLIGFFINMLVLRSDLTRNPTFKELLGRVREMALAAYTHQDMPFEKLVEELQPERTLSHNPLFQVLFQHRNYPKGRLGLGDLTIEEYEFENEIAKFDLSVGLREEEGALCGTIEYKTELFEPTTIERMIHHYRNLLEGIVADSNQRISELPFLSEAEKHQLLIEWNETKAEYAKDKCIHDLFEQQVEQTSDAIALVFEGKQLTYRELNQRSNQLAHYLRSKGVRPEVLVGICLERSIDMVVALLAVLKAGGAYVPLDPSYPEERLSFMVEDSGAKVILCQAVFEELFSSFRGSCIVLEYAKNEIERQPAETPVFEQSSDTLAYVIYTSGSTGTPKGVAMQHGALCNLISWQIGASSSTEGSKSLQFAPLSFDVSFQEMFSTWCTGGTLVMVSNEQRRDAAGLFEFVSGARVERLFIPVTMLKQLAEFSDFERRTGENLREIIVAGEALQISDEIKNFFATLKECRLINQYGPTESHVVTAFALSDSPQQWPTYPSIGRPIANTQIYILDSYLNPVPIGVSGELYLGGEGLARGYMYRPDLTAEKFIANPFSSEPGARIYRTGDLARYLADGNIEFLGRIDNQVKIRGFRIELGEIESVLVQHSTVREAVVVAREESPGNRRLIAYVVRDSGTAPSSQDLRRYVQQKLPEFMVPSTFVCLDELPLTPNGKVDRRSLPEPDRSRPELEEGYVAPRTAMEQLLGEIWTEVLKVEKVGIHDNFFELGGHSLLATQLISRIREGTEIDLPLKSIFEYPTIAEFGAYIESFKSTPGGKLAGRISRVPRITTAHAAIKKFNKR